MRVPAAIFLALLILPTVVWAKMTSVNIDGTFYNQIQDVHVVSGGRIVILYGDSGTTVTADKLPPGFLDSWGITTNDLAASKAAAEKEAETALTQSIRAGLFREVDGVVYDMRKPQAGWTRFANAKIMQMTENGALVDPRPNQADPTLIYVRNLPRVFADNDRVSFLAKFTGDFSYVNRFGFEKTVRSYDLGHTCQRNEIPDAIVKGGLAAANVPFGDHPRSSYPPSVDEVPGARGVSRIGSGFFITKDGYLLTNFHVVKDSSKIEVKYKTRTLAAEVITADEGDDLALLKVTGADFSALPLSQRDSEDLGDAVFTIGFPNITMQGLEPKYTDGRISSLAGMQDDPSEYQISVPVQPGNSGGPLCDTNGEVVGIVVARLNDLAALRESGAVPQNVNYAVKSKLALRMVRRGGGIAGLISPGKAPAKPVQAVEDAIAMIMVY